VRLIVLNDPAGITGKRIAPLDPAVSLQANIQRVLPLGAGDYELRINGEAVDPLTDPRMDVPPRAGDSVVLSARPEGVETALLVASFILSVAVYASLPKPEIPAIPTDSPNNRLAGQTNIARVYQAIPDVYGQRRVWPDLIQQTLIEYVDNLRTLTEWLCVSRGIGDIPEVRFGATLLQEIGGATWQAFYPATVGPVPPGAPPGYAEAQTTQLQDVNEPFACADVDGQEIGLDVSDDVIEQGATLDSNGTSTFFLTFVDGSQFDTIKALAPAGTLTVDFSYYVGGDPPGLGILAGTCTVLAATTDSGNVTFTLQAATTVPAEAAGQSVTARLSLATTSTWGQWFYLPVSANRIWFNLVFLRGLQGSVEIAVEWEQVSADGSAIPSTLETDDFTYTAATDAAQYRTTKITPAGGEARYRVRFRRVTADLGNGADVAKLEGLFAVRYYGTRNVPGVTVVRVTTTATEQATSSRERQFNCIWRRHVRTLSGDAVSHSRNFARVMAHIWTIAGEDIADLDTAALQAINTKHGETNPLLRFDGSLDDADMSLGERMQLVANHARCILWRDGAQWTVTRDEARELVEMQFDYRNLAGGGDSTISIAAHLPASEDGVEVEYVDEATGSKKAYARLNISTGAVVEGASRTPRRVTLPGCTTEAQAENRAQLEARKMLLQRTSVADRALDDGALVGPLSLVRWVDPADFYGDDRLQAGEVLAVSGTTITTSEPVQWGSDTSGRVLFTGDDGAYLAAAITCTPGAEPNEIVLGSSAPAGLYVRDDDRQLGSRYAVAVGVSAPEIETAGLFSVVDSRPQGDRTYALSLVNYTRKVYAADPDYGTLIEAGVGAAVASGPAADIGDGTERIAASVGVAAASGAGATVTVAAPINGANFSDGAVNGFGGTAIAGVRFRTTGPVAQAQGAGATSYLDYSAWFSGTATPSSWWVRFTTVSSSGGTVGGTGGGWLAMTSDRTVTLTAAPLETASASLTWEIAADSGGADIRATGAISLNAASTN
jgi:hypothetical protein